MHAVLLVTMLNSFISVLKKLVSLSRVFTPLLFFEEKRELILRFCMLSLLVVLRSNLISQQRCKIASSRSMNGQILNRSNLLFYYSYDQTSWQSPQKCSPGKQIGVSFNNLFYFIDKPSVHNFADDNSLSALESNNKNLKIILECESEKATWFQSNKTIVNPGKFQGIIIAKKKENRTAEYISID